MKAHEAARVERQTLSVEEAGRVLGVGRSLAYELARRGEIPAIRLGKPPCRSTDAAGAIASWRVGGGGCLTPSYRPQKSGRADPEAIDAPARRVHPDRRLDDHRRTTPGRGTGR